VQPHWLVQTRKQQKFVILFVITQVSANKFANNQKYHSREHRYANNFNALHTAQGSTGELLKSKVYLCSGV